MQGQFGASMSVRRLTKDIGIKRFGIPQIIRLLISYSIFTCASEIKFFCDVIRICNCCVFSELEMEIMAFDNYYVRV